MSLHTKSKSVLCQDIPSPCGWRIIFSSTYIVACMVFFLLSYLSRVKFSVLYCFFEQHSSLHSAMAGEHVLCRKFSLSSSTKTITTENNFIVCPRIHQHTPQLQVATHFLYPNSPFSQYSQSETTPQTHDPTTSHNSLLTLTPPLPRPK